MAVSGVGAVFLLQRMAERGGGVHLSECPPQLRAITVCAQMLQGVSVQLLSGVGRRGRSE